MVRDWLLIFAGLVGLSLFLLTGIATPALGHGHYDPTCCSDRDCAPVSAGTFEATPEGYRVTLRPGDHPLVTQTMTKVFPYDSPKIRDSFDGAYHACISPAQPVFFCIYVPSAGS